MHANATRRAVFGGLLATIAAGRQPAAGAQQDESFQRFVADFRGEALAHEISAGLYDAVLGPLTPDPAVAALTRRQPEFAKPMGAYLAAQVTAPRVAAGRERLARWRAVLDGIERRFGVPAAVVVAVWGLESNFGSAGGSKDVIRSLATLASVGYRPELYRPELIAALTMLRDGDATRDQLRGSWAGAMGQPQFMPSSYLRDAVDGDGDGRRDIWDSVPDSLASIAHFLHGQGWQAGEPWGFAVRLPAGFDMAGPSRATFAAWTTRGVRRTDGAPLPQSGTGILLFPVGAAGPAFLVTTNFEVIKTYNFSDAYVLSVGGLADRIAGGAGLPSAWPKTIGMPREDRVRLQSRLVALGYAVDDRRGRISLALRDVIRQAQRRVGLVPDGEPTAALLRALGS